MWKTGIPKTNNFISHLAGVATMRQRSFLVGFFRQVENGCIGCVSGKSLRTCVQKVGSHVRSKMAKFSYIGGVLSLESMVYSTYPSKSKFMKSEALTLLCGMN